MKFESSVTAWLAIIVSTAPLMLGCADKPPLRLEQVADSVTIDVQTLGEYQTTVRRIRLKDQTTGTVIWEIIASGSPQIHAVKLSLGENMPIVEGARGETYRVVTPAGGRFRLERERKYLVEVWGEVTEGTPASAGFEFGRKPDS